MLGSTPINILTLAVVYEGSTAIPLLFCFLSHKGSSSQAVRIELIELFIRIFGEDQIEWLTADREFIGKEWFIFLKEHDIPFYIRIKQIQYITDSKSKDSQPSFLLFQNRPCQVYYYHPSCVYLDGVAVYLSGHRITRNEYFIVASWIHPELAQAVYRQRWQIETMFKALKTKGFNLEDTQMKDPERLHKLLCLLAIAYTWAYTVGIWIHKQKITRSTKHSFFSLGFQQIQRAIIALPQKLPQLIELLKNDPVSFVRH
jgi:transposase